MSDTRFRLRTADVGDAGDDALDEPVSCPASSTAGWPATKVSMIPLMNARVAVAWSSTSAGSGALPAGCHWVTTLRASA